MNHKKELLWSPRVDLKLEHATLKPEVSPRHLAVSGMEAGSLTRSELRSGVGFRV